MKAAISLFFLLGATLTLADSVHNLRKLTVEGRMGDPADTVELVTEPENALKGCERRYPIDADNPGDPFTQEILRFPGVTAIDSAGQLKDGTSSVEWKELTPAKVEVDVTWSVEKYWQPPGDSIPGYSNYGPSVTVEAGPGYATFSATNIGTITRTLVVPAASWSAGAHSFRIKVHAPGPATASVQTVVRYDGRAILMGREQIPVGGNPWDVGTLIVHDEEQTGAYQVTLDENEIGHRDMYEAHGEWIREDGARTLFSYRHDLTIGDEDFTVKNEEDETDVFISVGESVQFQAVGRFMSAPGHKEDHSFAGNGFFKVTDISGGTDYIIDELGVLTLLSPGHVQVACAAGTTKKIDVYALDLDIIPDLDHNRIIDEADSTLLKAGHAFRLWINDDDDSGDEADGKSDLPGQGGLLDNSNKDDDSVNGRCDTLDFFPVWVDLHEALAVLPYDDNTQYTLTQDGAAVRLVYSDLTRSTAGSFLIDETNKFGPSLSTFLHESTTHEMDGSGPSLRHAFLDAAGINPKKGILLLEGVAKSSAPLRLSIERKGKPVYTTSVPLKVDNVENMMRWINLRGVTDGSVDRASDTTEPAHYPDSLCNGIQFVFVHGYNNDEENARATASEVFKRLYQSGSRAMFTALCWQGDESPVIIFSGLHYQADVVNAFLVASNTADAIRQLPGRIQVAAHSLGNMAVSSAITDYGLNPERYYMIDAAVALEAYNPAALQIDEMVPSDWVEYDPWLWASYWNELFALDDARRQLTWRNRFGNIPHAIQYYSTGEDILANGEKNPPSSSPPPSFSGENAWVFNELTKGGYPQWVLLGTWCHGGWGNNHAWDISEVDADGQTYDRRRSSEEANTLTTNELQQAPFFLPFDFAELHTPAGHQKAQELYVHAKLLAEAIPALSRASGANQLEGLGVKQVNLMSMKTQSLWPKSRGNDENWRHSDFRAVAFYYNQRFYTALVAEGELK